MELNFNRVTDQVHQNLTQARDIPKEDP